MKRFEKLLAVFLLSMPAGVTAVPAQQMPGSGIAVLDVQRVLRESLASKSIRRQMEKFQGSYQEDVRKQENAIRKAEQDLIQKRALLTPEVYTQRRRTFEEKARAAQRDVQKKKRQLDRAFGNAMGKVRGALIRIAASIADQRKINIVLPKSVVILSVKKLDITATTLERLNQQLPSVEVSLSESK